MLALPIDPFIAPIRASLATSRAVVVVAPAGAGKTTRLPPAFLDAGPAVLLQPRRVAARAVASRIAEERGWTVGREVGYQVRFDRRSSADTPLLVVTEGILNARLQADPLLSEFATVIIDEFHERSIQADLALAFSRQAWLARADFRVVVMSATLDAAPVAEFLGGCPVFAVPGRAFPLEVTYAPGAAIDEVAAQVVLDGDVLCFLPGAAEIRRTAAAIESRVSGRPTDVLQLHGGLDGDEQMRALRRAPTGRVRIVVATNIAETSVTVPGVTTVIDSGLQKVARYDAARGINSLITERISHDSAEQRAGRAGRTAAGRVVRLWDARDRLRPHREPDIHRIDLAAVVLDILAWGGQPRGFEWYEAPRDDAVAAAMWVLQRLGAVRDEALTPTGRKMHQLPVHPRLARMLIEGQGAWPIVQACALLSERQCLPHRTQATNADLLPAIDQWESASPHTKQIAADIGRVVSGMFGQAAARRTLDEEEFRRVVLAGYPDRVCQRRAPGSARVRLASGAGAVLGRESGVLDGEYLIALDVHAAPERMAGRSKSPTSAANESMIRIASRVEPAWLHPNVEEERHWFDASSGQVKAARLDRYDMLILRETPVPVDPQTAATLLAAAWLERGPDVEDERLLRRLRFAGHDVDIPALVENAVRRHRTIAEVRLADALDPRLLRTVDRDAPETLRVPSGRLVPLEYAQDGGVTASVKLQEVFGLRQTPRVGASQQPVLLALLAPNGRPVQLTRDLASFWTRTYPEVRRELRGRYPRHPWPEDPLTATPTSRTKSRTRDQAMPPGKKTR